MSLILHKFSPFQGVVAFSSQGDRIALTQIEQMVDGHYYKLGYYDTQADNLTWFNNEQWIGGKVSFCNMSLSRTNFQFKKKLIKSSKIVKSQNLNTQYFSSIQIQRKIPCRTHNFARAVFPSNFPKIHQPHSFK